MDKEMHTALELVERARVDLDYLQLVALARLTAEAQPAVASQFVWNHPVGLTAEVTRTHAFVA